MKNKEKTDRKVIATIRIEDRGQEFLEVEVLENSVLLGYSIMFSEDRCRLYGIGTPKKMKYDFSVIKEKIKQGRTKCFENLCIYLNDKDYLRYKILEVITNGI